MAAAVFTSDVPCWEFDIRAVPPGTEPVPISDWERRRRIKQAQSGSEAGGDSIAPLAPKEDGHLRGR